MALTVGQLAGYVDRDLDADLGRWFPSEPCVDIPASTRSVEPFLAKLRTTQRPRWPVSTSRSDREPWRGFSSIGCDGASNYYVVLTSGRVAVWLHEEQVIEAHTQFDNLDVFLWSVVRSHAVRAGALDLAAVEPDFRSLGQPGVLAPKLGLLAHASPYVPR
ncbi:hypothetical protein OG501_37580 [Streptomyces niveus]|uniref:hypothetical protein n=1 Tax=Streptomyces niveus TaxID=193462 RepID=UPI003867C4AE